MDQAGPFAAFAAGAMPVTAAVAATRVMMTTRGAASLCFTRFSLSAARRSLDGHDRMRLGLETRNRPCCAWAGAATGLRGRRHWPLAPFEPGYREIKCGRRQKYTKVH